MLKDYCATLHPVGAELPTTLHGWTFAGSSVRRADADDAKPYLLARWVRELPEPHPYGPGWYSCPDCGCDHEGSAGLCDGCHMRLYGLKPVSEATADERSATVDEPSQPELPFTSEGQTK